jgi:hypothetical protein
MKPDRNWFSVDGLAVFQRQVFHAGMVPLREPEA